MMLAEAIAEARAIDGRAVSGVVPPLEDTLRAFELTEFFADLVDRAPTEEQQCLLAIAIVERLR